MSMTLIQAALEKHLLSLTPAIATAYENKSYEPAAGIPYQRLHHLLNEPLDIDLEANTVQERGLFQVSLFYPLDVGRVLAMARALAIRNHFRPVQYLHEGSVRVDINDTPRIARGMPDGDRWHVAVTVRWSAFVAAEIVLPQPPVWILETGSWDDGGQWMDDKPWTGDGLLPPPVGILSAKAWNDEGQWIDEQVWSEA